MHLREVERAQLKRKLEAGLSIHMPAPRRIGKTWTINRLAEDLRRDGWHAIEVDVEGINTPQAFARDLCTRIEAQNSIRDRFKTHAVQRITNILGGSWGDKPLDALGKIDPIEFSETLIAAIDASNEKSAILIDEISYFYLALAENDAKEAHSFAYKLRALQQRYKNVRWLITGSIGLDIVARRFGLEGAFVDFETYILEPFTKEQALSYMRDKGIQQQFNRVFDADREVYFEMFENLGWLTPYYLKMIANEVIPSITANVQGISQATKSDFDDAFEKLLRPNRQLDFSIWREHIKKNFPASDRTIAWKILEVLCPNADGENDHTIISRLSTTHGEVKKRQLRDVLGMLANDGLITKSDDRYKFRSGLVRRYWQEYEAE